MAVHTQVCRIPRAIGVFPTETAYLRSYAADDEGADISDCSRYWSVVFEDERVWNTSARRGRTGSGRRYRGIRRVVRHRWQQMRSRRWQPPSSLGNHG